MGTSLRRAWTLSAAPAAAALAILACSCGTSPASHPAPAAKASSPAAGQAAGQDRAAAGGRVAGGKVQGVTVGVPDGWKVADFSRTSLPAAYAEFSLPGLTEQQFAQSFQQLAGVHGIVAMDTRHVAAALGDQGDVLPNENAYCTSWNGATGAAGLAGLQQEAASTVRQEMGTVTRQQDITAGGVPAVETFYSPMSPAPGISERAVSVAAAPRTGQACYAFLTYPATSIPGGLLGQVTGAITYP